MIENLINQQANNFAKEKSTLELYKVVILLLIVLALMVSIYSVYASFGELERYIVPHLQNETIGNILAGIGTVLIEGITVYMVLIFFYLLWKKKETKQLIPFLVIGIIFYAANFYLSTNGLKNRSETKIDISTKVNDSINQAITALNRSTSVKIDSINKVILPHTLKITATGQDIIRNGNNEKGILNEYLILKVANLENSRNKLILENDKNVATTGNKSFNFFAIVQLLQILLHALTTRLFVQIRKEEMTEDELQNELSKVNRKHQQELERTVATNVLSASKNAINKLVNVKESDEKQPTTAINTPINQVVEPEKKKTYLRKIK